MTQAQYSNLSSRSQHISPMTQRTKKNQWSHHSRIFSKKTGQAASVHDCKLHSKFFSKEGRRHRIFIPEPLVLATKTPIYISTCPRLDRLLFDKDKEDLQTFRAQNSPTIHTVCGCGPQTSSLRPTYSLQSFNRMETSSNLQ
jgi:hypothetical protein